MRGIPAYRSGLLAGGVRMLANTIAEIMITTNATMMAKHPKSVRRATMRRSISRIRSVIRPKGYVTARAVPRLRSKPPGTAAGE